MPVLTGRRGAASARFTVTSLKDSEIFALAPHRGAGQCCVYIWRHNFTAAGLDAMLRRMCPEGQDTAARTETAAPKSEKRRCELLSVLLLAKRLFGTQAGVAHTADGAPALTGVTDAPHISVSHSGGAYALSAAPVPHGTDIELHSPKAHRLKEKFLTTAEWALAPATGQPPEAAATLMWSAKEAVYKCRPQSAGTLTGIRLTAARSGLIEATVTADGTALRVGTECGDGGTLAVARLV